MDLYVTKDSSFQEALNHFPTLEKALAVAQEYDIIHITKGIYKEKITVAKPNLSLIGDNETVLTFDAAAGQIVPEDLGGDGIKTFGTTGSASVTILESAINFKAENIIFQNSFNRLKSEIKGTQAVAVKVSAPACFTNCSFVGAQDTLYPDVADKIIFNNCCIEGDVDFIFGSANALFNHCRITAIDIGNNAYFIAPDTFTHNKYGFCFNECTFLTSGNNDVYLGRPWYPSKHAYPVFPTALFYKCIMDSKIHFEYVPMRNSDNMEHNMKMLLCNINNTIYSDTSVLKEKERITFIKRNA